MKDESKLRCILNMHMELSLLKKENFCFKKVTLKTKNTFLKKGEMQ